jgi:hypothetical protein
MAESTHPGGEGRELVQDQQGVLALAGFAAGGVVAVVLQHHPHGRIRLGLGQQGGDGGDGQLHVLIAPRPAVEGAGQGGEEVGVPQAGAGEVLGDGLDVLELEGPPIPEGGQLVDVQAAEQLI